MADASVEIRPVVVGTAGHIDHGKSTLVRALTGVDPDRLEEERRRGLTIDLGFAPLELSDGRLVGIVDVPGHERFIKNMVAGASGIDLVVLVVAADDGVMPQTREHLQILELLGVGHGFVALTKVDAVDGETVELARADVESLVEGTFLAGAPVVAVSATEETGLDELRRVLEELCGSTPPRSDDGVFRMPVQRVFTKAGFGTVVTGIPVAGSVGIGEEIEILPGRARGRVRGIQAYRRGAERARAGHSTALNLSDVDHRSLRRGCVAAAPGFFAPARMLGARVRALDDLARPLRNRMAVRAHVGTDEAIAELVLLDVGELAPGAEALAQLRFARPVVVAPGDRFVLRLPSPARTLGGGVVLEESRHRLKRFKAFVIDELSSAERHLGTPAERLGDALARRGLALSSAEELAVELKRSHAETRALLERLAEEGVAVRPGAAERWIHAGALARAAEEFERAVDAWFERHPHRGVVDVRDLRGAVGFEAELLSALIAREAAAGRLESLAGGKLRRAGREVRLDEETRARGEGLLRLLARDRFRPPAPEELARELGADRTAVERDLERLVDAGELVRVQPGLHLLREAWEEVRERVRENCERNGRLEIPELRDGLGTSRKFLIPMLERLDAEGFTRRQGSHRVLRRS